MLAGSPAAAERFDHRGAVGLLLGGGLEWKEGVAFDSQTDIGLRIPIDVGATYAIGYDGNELMAFGRVSLLGARVDTSFACGYRGYFGEDRFKTFFDLGLQAHFTPRITAGARVGMGVQYELSPLIGTYTGLASQIGFGNGLRFDAELLVGIQLRSYLLE
ncbi:MAG: hypothetical protein IRZ16_00745 [Myxococcaceae bacterium]|nr:hypothetical protein [Myxococcaceae bacterium]